MTLGLQSEDNYRFAKNQAVQRKEKYIYSKFICNCLFIKQLDLSFENKNVGTGAGFNKTIEPDWQKKDG